ncbi:hypothetical protein G7Z17_g5781 [Cylindrodendrum hubeiense]|uniref:TRP C-terminal domain-containing protein n=1 Tax=Cylindrodendrum hubeiense TaxID=595255 RepID=A0A9P5H6I2_9HYPO|nr:hypothetical protein G7Z17_g5781 [Cylindrodendrum hubeiense]
MSTLSLPFCNNSLSLSSYLILFTLILSFARPSLAAYVQYKDCFPLLVASGHHVSSQPHRVAESLGAFLEDDGDESQLRLHLLGNFPDLSSCEQILRQNVTVGVTLLELGSSDHYSGDIVNASCYPSPWAKNGAKQLESDLKILVKLDRPHPLAAFKLNVDLRGADDLPVGCVNGFLTPAIRTTTYDACLWGPLAIFMLVILAAGWREVSNAGRIDEEDEDCPNSQVSARLHLTRIADCLSYIQFIFFSGALSLRYPGFVQPAVSPTSWSTLMLPRGPVIQHSVYYGVKDGIYEINGTFGGTPGLELMTQVIGAPVTMHTWTNIVSLALVILFFLFGTIQLGLSLGLTRDWFREASFWTLQRSAADRHKATVWVVLRVFLSYFLMPIVSWTAYQLDQAIILPKYYTIIASFVICLVLIACWWGMSQRSPQNMGYLIIDGFQEEQTSGPTSQNQDLYTLVTFILLFVRGAAIGGLQEFGIAQVLVLLGCEIAQLGLMTWAWSISSLFSRAAMVPCARLCVMLACIGMIPNISGYEASSAVGYSILVFHLLILIVLFLIPALYDIIELSLASLQNKSAPITVQDEGRPQIYGLRQLHRRPNTRNNLSISGMNNFDQSSSSSGNSDTLAFRSPRVSSLESDNRSPELLRAHFRSPKSEISTPNLIDKSLQHQVPEESSSPGSRSSTQSDAGPIPLELPIPRSSTPGVDYSFREADLYYVRPRQVSFRQNGNESNSARGNFMQKLKFWVRGG